MATNIAGVRQGGTGTANRTLVSSAGTTTVDWQNRNLSGGDWSFSNGVLLGTSATASLGTLRRSPVTGVAEVYHDNDWRSLNWEPSTDCVVTEDWMSGGPAGTYGWTTTAVGTGAIASLSTTNMNGNHWGVLDLATGTTATGSCSAVMSFLVMQLGSGSCWFELLINLSALATVGQDYVFRAGLGDTTNSTDFVDGVYFEYNRALSANWIIKTANNSARTTGTPPVFVPVAAGAWTKLACLVNAAGTLATYFVNGAQYGTVATNIPTAAGRDIGPAIVIASTGGASSKTVSVDYYQLLAKFTTAR